MLPIATLPAAALAMWHTARLSRRRATGALMISVALTAFLTGITEPLEYAFAYVAFPLYAVHAILTGTSLALVNALGIKDGFAFCAGGIDYFINLGKSAELSGGYLAGPVLLAGIGLAYGVVYYLAVPLPDRPSGVQDPSAVTKTNRISTPSNSPPLRWRRIAASRRWCILIGAVERR